MFYQKNPVFAVFLIGLMLGIYLFVKARKARGNATGSSFLSGSRNPQTNNTDELLRFLLLQQIIGSGKPSLIQYPPHPKKLTKRQEQIERTKKEVLELLEP